MAYKTKKMRMNHYYLEKDGKYKGIVWTNKKRKKRLEEMGYKLTLERGWY